MTATTDSARGGFAPGREGTPRRRPTRRARTAVGRFASVHCFGATPTEADDPMPGDDLVPVPLFQITQAVTVAASPETVWPWLMQSGQGKAGFYSDSRLWNACVDWYYGVLSRERGLERERYDPVDDHIVADWQDRTVGDLVMDGPPGTAYYVVREVAPNRVKVSFTDTHLPHLVPARWRSGVRGELSDATALVRLADGHTRMVHRVRFAAEPLVFRFLAVPVVLLWGEALTSARFLRGVRRRAEQSAQRPKDRLGE